MTGQPGGRLPPGRVNCANQASMPCCTRPVQLTAVTVAVDAPPGRTLAGRKPDDFTVTAARPAHGVR
jgi:hypothetical protein